MLIPYIVKPRPDTGLTNGKFGIWLFLASEVMLFGALFATYLMLRLGSTDWPLGTDFLDPKWAALNTVILITSSVTMVMAWAMAAKRNFNKFRFFMLLTVALGFGFMIVKFIEYSAKFDHHYYPSTHVFLAIYFTLTGLHGLHVLGGMCVNGYFALFGRKHYDADPEWFTNRIENSGLFWHFVDLVWIFLFPILYLL
jgi:heme/copper-type cytochrome/quinol oxidase subunit 3